VDIREQRLRAKLVRHGGHDIWTGSTDASGKGLVRIDGKLRTAQRAAWEFAHGPLEPGDRVLACPDERSCVRVEHLSLAPRAPIGPTPQRRRRGSGSMRELRPGVWQLTVSDGPGPDGTPRRRHLTVHGSEADAAERLAALAETARVPTSVGDLRVRELIDRYLFWLGDDEPDTTYLRELQDGVLEAAIGRQFAALVTVDDVDRALETVRDAGATVADVHAARDLIKEAYTWATRRHWFHQSPLPTEAGEPRRGSATSRPRVDHRR
jgi:hypothetical protein